ncbi:MAG: two-component regulator propeller domain-containing protein [Peptostreptococcaceae bacterium]
MLVLTNTSNILAYTDINFRNITNEDGLSQATVETMIQDKKGYVWIGTNDGLNRYNGYDFKVYRHDEYDSNTISNNYIVDLQEDKKGNIWVGTANGLSKINVSNDEITNYTTGKEGKYLSHYNIGDILVTKSGKVIVATSDGLNIYNEKEDKFERILKEEGTLSSQLIYTLAEDGYGNIWVATKLGLNKIDIKNKKIEYFTSGKDKNSISEDNVYGLKYDNKGYMWAGTFKEGLNKIDIQTGQVKVYKNNPNDKHSLGGNFIKDILRDSSGNLWVGTNGGLSRYNDETDDFTSWNNKIYDKASLVEDEIFTIIEDTSGMIWLGTYAGISIFNPNNKIEHYKKDPFDKNTINDNVIHGMYEDDDGLLWIGTNSKGVNIVDRKNNTVKYIDKNSEMYPLSDDSVNDIKGYEDLIFVATNNGVNKIDKSNKTIILYTEEDGLPDNNSRTLFLDSKGCLWIGSTNGVSILDIKNNKIIDISDILEKNKITDMYIRVIFEDRQGDYWIGCFRDGGLIKIDTRNKTIKSYKNEDKNENSISNNTVRSIGEDDYGNLWIGTSYGLNKFDENKEEFVRYSTKDGLANNTVYGILIDDENNPWVSTNLGISKLDIKTNSFENLGITDGIQGNEFNGSAYYKNKDGEFFFGGINGFNIFNPKDIEKIKTTPQVKFGEFEIKGKKYHDINNLQFKHNENFINIEVFLPDYKNPKSTQYLYKLEGANDDWNLLESNKINYSNLYPGKYTLKVKARNHNGMISEENSVKFKIKPPFWASGFAFLIYILIILASMYYYINRVKRLDKIIKSRTEQLNEEMEKSNTLLNKVIDLERNKNKYFVNLSHELRTPLNVIHCTEQLITGLNKSGRKIEVEKLEQYMSVVRRNTKRLLSLINNLMDSSKIESDAYQINIEKHNIVYIVEEATLSLKSYIEDKGLELIIDPEIEEKIISCDSYEIERCIVNLVSNAVKFTPKGGTIKVVIQELNDKVKIVVSDTGIGIDKKYHGTIFNRFNQVTGMESDSKVGSGLGLTITKQIIDMHGGSIYVESEVNKGSKFNIIL